MGMKITLLTYGSRGDVQPFVPLSLGLMARGHTVKLAAPWRFKDLVEGYGISFVPLAGEPEILSRRFNDAGSNSIKMIGGMMDYVTEIAVDVLRQTGSSCQDADLIILLADASLKTDESTGILLNTLKNIKKQTKALLNLFVRVKDDFIVLIIDKSGRQPRFKFPPPGFA